RQMCIRDSAYLHTVVERLEWDRLLRDALERTRLVMLPLVNPVGMTLGRRSNGRGVDLMRNGPVGPFSQGSFLVGGQRLSPLVPWYAGDGHSMEPEARALCRFVAREVLPSRASVAIDCHSGFGLVDRLWFPYARSRRPFPGLAEAVAMHRLLERTFPHHVYRMEPQAQAYTIEGDLWDHLYDRRRDSSAPGFFLPMTLEMGSWNWVRKNPRQLVDPLGGFNPMVPHRRDRTLRRHLPLFDFLLAAVASYDRWEPANVEQRRRLEDEGFLRWFGRR
ncbi:MAG: M14 family zinc carboxypeptidase, partial [Candidatus Eisenbacteria bacterium]|nr:M14 family zinc carboxypeptidase [Candidatus Eisenbacteria bacterium]